MSRVGEGAATALGLSTNAADRYLEASKRFQAACVYTPVNWSMREEGEGGAGSYWAEAVAGRVTAGNVEIFDHNKLFTMTMTTTASTMGQEDDDDNDDGCACNSNRNVQQQRATASRTARPARIPRVEMRKAVANCELFCLGSVRQKLVFYCQ